MVQVQHLRNDCEFIKADIDIIRKCTIRIPGHEVLDREKIGEGVEGLSIGQNVFIAPIMGRDTASSVLRVITMCSNHFDAFGITIVGGLLNICGSLQ
jgi:D-arabinose 1-dehydrogenase-like Zn-dependent alcohol dehydrogenase